MGSCSEVLPFFLTFFCHFVLLLRFRVWWREERWEEEWRWRETGEQGSLKDRQIGLLGLCELS